MFSGYTIILLDDILHFYGENHFTNCYRKPVRTLPQFLSSYASILFGFTAFIFDIFFTVYNIIILDNTAYFFNVYTAIIVEWCCFRSNLFGVLQWPCPSYDRQRDNLSFSLTSLLHSSSIKEHWHWARSFLCQASDPTLGYLLVVEALWAGPDLSGVCVWTPVPGHSVLFIHTNEQTKWVIETAALLKFFLF